MADAYLWSEIEPGTAILCACAVTYRPLFTNVKISFSSLIRRGKQPSSGDIETHTEDSQRQYLYGWPAASHKLRDSMTYHNMHAKVTKPDLHAVKLGQANLGSHTTCKAVTLDKKNLPKQSPALMVTRNIEVVTDSGPAFY